MSFDQKTPQALKECQVWFASIVTQPINTKNRIPVRAPSGTLIEKEARKYIKPSPTLRPDQRIEIYSQQYWWRLFKTLHEIFPMVTCLFGYSEFNKVIAIPYLLKYPPTHWSLNHVGEYLPKWFRETYKQKDKKLVLAAAELDWAYHEGFITKNLKPVSLEDLPDPQDISSLLNEKLYLQPSVHFFEFESDLFTVRQEFTRHDADYWSDHEFPIINKSEKPFILFKGPYGGMIWDALSKTEILLLRQFKEGSTIEGACEWLENEGESLYAEAEQNLHLWIQGWLTKGLLSLEMLRKGQ